MVGVQCGLCGERDVLDGEAADRFLLARPSQPVRCSRPGCNGILVRWHLA